MMLLYLFILLCVLCYVVCDASCLYLLGVSNSNMFGCLTYQIGHLGVLHLIVNMYSLYAMFRCVSSLYHKRYYPTERESFLTSDIRLFIIVYIGSVLSGLICCRAIATVGASGMVFFLLGMLIIMRPTKEQLKGYIWVLVAMLIQIYFGKSNTALHIVSFVGGSLFVIVKESIKIFNEHRGIHTDKR